MQARMMTIVGAAVLCAALVENSTVRAQAWRLDESARPEARIAPITSFDRARSELVVIGGARDGLVPTAPDTWTWSSVSGWSRHPDTLPVQLSTGGASMAYDPVRDRTVMFGTTDGFTGHMDNGTWEWDGTIWTERTLAVSPSPRRYHTMAYDDVQGVVLMFGGLGIDGAALPELWQYDGTSWTLLSTPTLTASCGAFCDSAFDSQRGCLVISTHRGNTLEWDGANWHEYAVVASPSQLAFDPSSRTVVATAINTIGTDSQTYSWNGTAWEALQLPLNRLNHDLATDWNAGRVIAFGGDTPFDPVVPFLLYLASSTIDFLESGAWQLENDRTTLGREWSAASYADGIVVTGGQISVFPQVRTSRVYELATGDGQWSASALQSAPTIERGDPIGYHRADDELMLFNSDGETWSWEGTTWIRRQPASQPPPRPRPSIAYDEGRERLVMHGGYPAFDWFDTWEWDGADWTEVATRATPLTGTTALFTFNTETAMVYDSNRDRLLLFGTAADGVDVFEFIGNNWSRIPSGSGPLNYFIDDRSMVFDPVLDTVLFLQEGTLWRWDDGTWSVAATDTSPNFETLLFDEGRGCTIGIVDAGQFWEFRGARPPALLPFGESACGLATLAAPPLTYPILGRTTPFEIRNSDPGSSNLLMIGDSRTFAPSLGTNLPIPLDSLGLIGCSLLQSAELTLAANANAMGTSRYAILVPPNPGLLGMQFFVQGLASELATPTLGTSLTTGLEATIGR